MSNETSFNPPDEELEQRAKQFAERAEKLLEELTPHSAVTHGDIKSLQYFLQSQNCYAELNRRDAIRRAHQDKRESEDRADRDRKRETRHFWVELIFTILITAMIGVELYLSIHYGRLGLNEGRQQAAILQDVKKSTADSAEAIQQATASLKTLVAQQAESLRISQNEQAERAKKPRLELYIGQVSLKAANRPFKPRVETDTSATFDIVVRNAGEATANKVIWRALVPPDVALNSTPNATPANDLPDRPIRAFLYFQDLIPPKGYVETTITFIFPKGHAPFVVKFNASSPEVTGETPLGLLPIFPTKPAN